jgi:hypothetical protein
MMRYNHTNRVGCALIVALAASCSSSADQSSRQASNRDSTVPARPAAGNTSSAQERRAALNAYLAAALYMKDGKIPDSLAACDDDYAPAKKLALAAYEVLAGPGDTATVIPAQVMSVAQFEPSEHDAEKTIATVRIRVDTLHWSVVRDTSRVRWIVCGFSKEGFDFADSASTHDVEWRPIGTSGAAITRLIDSIGHAQKTSP